MYLFSGVYDSEIDDLTNLFVRHLGKKIRFLYIDPLKQGLKL